MWREGLREYQVQIEAAVFETKGRVARPIKPDGGALQVK